MVTLVVTRVLYIQDIEKGIQGMSKIGQILVILSYLAGVAMGLAAILKFKQHKNLPTQVTIIIVVTYLSVSFVGLLALLKRIQMSMIPPQSIDLAQKTQKPERTSAFSSLI